MEFIPNKIMQELGELTALQHHTLLMAACKGCALREIRQLNQPAGMGADGNDLHAQVAIAIADRLETLIRNGNRLNVSLNHLTAEGWIEKYDNSNTGSN